jgi:hypothetical protein
MILSIFRVFAKPVQSDFRCWFSFSIADKGGESEIREREKKRRFLIVFVCEMNEPQWEIIVYENVCCIQNDVRIKYLNLIPFGQGFTWMEAGSRIFMVDGSHAVPSLLLFLPVHQTLQ